MGRTSSRPFESTRSFLLKDGTSLNQGWADDEGAKIKMYAAPSSDGTALTFKEGWAAGSSGVTPRPAEPGLVQSSNRAQDYSVLRRRSRRRLPLRPMSGTGLGTSRIAITSDGPRSSYNAAFICPPSHRHGCGASQHAAC